MIRWQATSLTPGTNNQFCQRCNDGLSCKYDVHDACGSLCDLENVGSGLFRLRTAKGHMLKWNKRGFEQNSGLRYGRPSEGGGDSLFLPNEAHHVWVIWSVLLHFIQSVTQHEDMQYILSWNNFCIVSRSPQYNSLHIHMHHTATSCLTTQLEQSIIIALGQKAIGHRLNQHAQDAAESNPSTTKLENEGQGGDRQKKRRDERETNKGDGMEKERIW